MNECGLTQKLARLIAESRPERNKEAMQAARMGLTDYFASAFAARDDEGIARLWSVAEAEGGREDVPVVGQGRKSSFRQAALLNGYLGHALDYDDVHSDVRGHPSTVILPALLSAAAAGGVSGERLLAAYVIGVETMARFGRAIGAEHYLRGWHNTATLGGIAAAAAAGYLLGFTEERLQKAIGFAATQAGGLRNQFGTETKPLHAGMAAQAALLAVKLTEAGFGGTLHALDGTAGFFGVYGDLAAAEANLLDGWGESWRIVNPGLWFKIYPFCSAAHHAADAAVLLRQKHPLAADDIGRVDIVFPTGGDAALIERQPRTGEQGRFSVEYVAALALLGEPLSVDSFASKPIAPHLLELLPRIRRVYDDSIEPAPHAVPKGRYTIVEVTARDGRSFRERIDCPRGAPGNALTPEDLRQKLEGALAAEPARAAALLDTIARLQSAADVERLLELL
ncbi:MmgE/PrpD family protein [Paenibacillus konkukensis]|uniref:MmgE/PrpD family protein n=1 Tax=Paenibacillus konkukensis TaxID=2020716 RepID=A0ABY4RJB9_9BACL|nr:MmgE/PrpD family protein [Paenibacillus konkukensis]UQZ82223.1 MmgE/PrpD family protein [Paenibacillus konkukensis]